MKMPTDELSELKKQNKEMRDLLEQAVKGTYGVWSNWVTRAKEVLKGLGK